MELKDKESALEAAAAKLGNVMMNLSPENKQVLRTLKEEAEAYCDKAKEDKNEYVDKASLFVLAITLDDNLKAMTELQKEAQNYLEADKDYTMALMEKLMSQV